MTDLPAFAASYRSKRNFSIASTSLVYNLSCVSSLICYVQWELISYPVIRYSLLGDGVPGLEETSGTAYAGKNSRRKSDRTTGGKSERNGDLFPVLMIFTSIQQILSCRISMFQNVS